MTGPYVGSALLDDCVDTLLRWPAPGPDQERLRRRFLDHLTERGDGWSRTCPDSHLTASALICAPAERVLLTLHAKIGRWLQTGGHLEGSDTSLASAGLREAVEESGITHLRVDPLPLLLSRHEVACGGRSTWHLDVQFLVTAAGPLTPVVGEESLDVAWFAADGLPEVDASVTELVAAAGRRLGWR